MMDAEPASDHQLAFVRAFASQARDPGSLAYVRGLLDGTEQLGGLQVDTELRWHLLQCLTAFGQLGEQDIAAEQAKDPTATGQRRAETARALQPDPAVKHAVWERVTTDLTVPNAVLESLIAGLWHPSQRELLRPYTDRYFSAVAGVWESHTTSLAQGIAVGTYPCAGRLRAGGGRGRQLPGPRRGACPATATGGGRAGGHPALAAGSGARPPGTLSGLSRLLTQAG